MSSESDGALRTLMQLLILIHLDVSSQGPVQKPPVVVKGCFGLSCPSTRNGEGVLSKPDGSYLA